MHRKLVSASIPALLGVAFVGCTTTSSQEESMIYDHQRRIVTLEEKVNSQVPQSTAELSARLDSIEQNAARAGTTGEDAIARIETLQRELENLKTRVYRTNDLSQSPTTTSAPSNEVKTGPVELVGPGGTTVTVSPPPPGATSQLTVEPEPEMERVNVAVATPTPVPAPAPAPVPAEPIPVASAPAPPAAGGDPQVYYQAAQKSYASDNFQQAAQQFDDFLQRYPGSELSANAQFWKAKSHLKLNQYQDAIGEFQKLVNNYPNSTKVPYAIHNQAVAHSNLGQIPEAVRLMQRVVDEYPLSPAAEQAKTDLKQLQGS